MRQIMESITPAHIAAIAPSRANDPVRSLAYPSLKDLTAEMIETGVIGQKGADEILRGKPELVASADALMSKFERFDLMAPRKSWEDNVAGVLPNVPAFIAGHPMSMRRKIVHRQASAPIALVMELTGSGGLADTFKARGAAYLALARLLTARRPVELWLSVTFNLNAYGGMAALFVRLETDPLHLAVAANAMIDRPFLEAFCLQNRRRLASGGGGGWAWGQPSLERHKPELTYKPMLGHVSDLVVFPATYLFDEAAKDPEKWVANQLARLCEDSSEDAA